MGMRPQQQQGNSGPDSFVSHQFHPVSHNLPCAESSARIDHIRAGMKRCLLRSWYTVRQTEWYGKSSTAPADCCTRTWISFPSPQPRSTRVLAPAATASAATSA
jgi:hypothetical protein